MDVQALLEQLDTLSGDQYDALLEDRDAPPFEELWLALYHRVAPLKPHPEQRAHFIALSNLTAQHELTEAVSDDLDLIWACEQAGLADPFITFMRELYSRGRVPTNAALREVERG